MVIFFTICSDIKIGVAVEKLNHSREFLRQRASEGHFLAGDRVKETQGAGMQSQSVGRIAPRPIFIVANNRATGLRKLDAYLVSAPGIQGELNKGSMGIRSQDAVVRHRMAGIFIG
jgi:hypothetical protein